MRRITIPLTPREISFHERKDLFSLHIPGLYCPHFTGVGGLYLHGSGALSVIVTNVAVWVFELLLYLVLGEKTSLVFSTFLLSTLYYMLINDPVLVFSAHLRGWPCSLHLGNFFEKGVK